MKSQRAQLRKLKKMVDERQKNNELNTDQADYEQYLEEMKKPTLKEVLQPDTSPSVRPTFEEWLESTERQKNDPLLQLTLKDIITEEELERWDDEDE